MSPRIIWTTMQHSKGPALTPKTKGPFESARSVAQPFQKSAAEGTSKSMLSGLAISLLVRQPMAGLPLGAEVVPPSLGGSVAT